MRWRRYSIYIAGKAVNNTVKMIHDQYNAKDLERF